MALSFDGISQYVSIPGSSSLDCPSAMTITFWCYGKSDAQNHILNKDDDDTNRIWIIRPESSTSLNCHVWTSTGKLINGAVANSFALNAWHFYTMRAYVSGGNVYVETWMDGVYKGENHAAGTALKTATAQAIQFCKNIYVKGYNYYSGILSDVRIYNRSLSANEIAEIYHKRGADRVWQGLVGWWRLDEMPSGITAENVDVAPHNMTANDSPAPYKASASSEYSADRKAYKAFDGTNGVWGATGTSGWLKLDYGDGNAPVLKGYAIKSYEDPKFQTVMPKNWTFKGSNDNSNWTTLDTRTNITGWTANEWREFWFDNTTGYRYYMIDISANNGYSIATYIAEMKHFTTKFQALDLSGNGNHGAPYNSPVYQASPHRLRRGVLVS